MIVRGPHPARDFVVLTNRVVRDRRLSFKARGILVYVLSLPPGSQTSATALAEGSGSDGRSAVLSGLAELEASGYLTRTKIRLDNGQFRQVSTIYEEPVADQPASESPSATTGGPESDMPGCVYYVQLRDGNIKIGYSAEPSERTQHHDGEWVAAERGSFTTERQRHSQFAAFLIPGAEEVFATNPELEALIQQLRREARKPLSAGQKWRPFPGFNDGAAASGKPASGPNRRLPAHAESRFSDAGEPASKREELREQELEEPKPSSVAVNGDEPTSGIVDELCQLLADAVAEHGAARVKPVVSDVWRRHMSLLLRRGPAKAEPAPVEPERVARCIAVLFSELAIPDGSSGFCWADQVQSPAALRAHWTKIANAARGRRGAGTPAAKRQRMFEEMRAEAGDASVIDIGSRAR